VNQLLLGTPWSKSGGRVTAPPIRVPVEDGRLGCAIALVEGRGEPTPWVERGTDLPLSVPNYAEARESGQAVANFELVAIDAHGAQEKLACFRVDGWDRDARRTTAPLFALELGITCDDAEESAGWAGVTFIAEGKGTRLRVESVPPPSSVDDDSVLQGVVVSDAFVPVADVALMSGLQVESRAVIREPFELRLDGGRMVRIDPTRARLEDVETVRTVGRWETLHSESFAVFMLFPKVQLARYGPLHTWQTAERVVCAGDRVTVTDVGVAVGDGREGYREAGAELREVQAEDVRVQEAVPRDRARLSDAERLRYRVDQPPRAPEYIPPKPRPELKPPDPSAVAASLTLRRLLLALIAFLFVLAMFVARGAYRERGETNGFTRAFDGCTGALRQGED